MTDDSSGIAIANARLACQAVVRALIEEYDWALLEDDELVGLVLGSTQPEASPVELERLTKHHYTIALYEACRQTQDAKRRERGYEELYRFLYRAAYNRWPELAEDAAQRALELVHEQIDRCRNPAAFLSFAFYKLLDAFRRERRLAGKELPWEEIGQDKAADDQSMIESRLDQEERLRALVDAIRRLPDKRRQEVIVLKFFAGLSDEAIADRLGITVGNVRVLRHRGLMQLRKDKDLRDYFEQTNH